MKDLENRADIEKLVLKFYESVHADPKIAAYFTMTEERWQNHLTRTINFWENWLFQTGNYHGGLMWAHIEKHMDMPIKTAAFERWLSHWFRTIENNFAGEKADFLITKALELGQMMNQRLNAPVANS